MTLTEEATVLVLYHVLCVNSTSEMYNALCQSSLNLVAIFLITEAM